MKAHKFKPSISTLLLIAIILGSANQYYRQGQVSWLTDAFRAAEGASRDWYAAVKTAVNASPAQQTTTSVQSIDFSGRVTKVKDGDSLLLSTGSGSGFREYEIRLHGIDAPEWNQAYGKAAKRKLASLVLNRKVDVNSIRVDSYGRTVATVFRQGKNINLEMVNSGNAWWYQRYAASDQALANAEQTARAARLGLWRQAQPTPPWVWRRR